MTRKTVEKQWRHQTVNPEVFEAPKETVRGMVQRRARASFYDNLHQAELIASGEAETVSVSTTTGKDGGEVVTRTVSRPSAKDRIAALQLLGKYGRLDPADDKSGGSSDPQVMVRALVAALREPGVRQALLSDPRDASLLRLLSAEEVDIPPEA